jgi:hypothetical protein
MGLFWLVLKLWLNGGAHSDYGVVMGKILLRLLTLHNDLFTFSLMHIVSIIRGLHWAGSSNNIELSDHVDLTSND